MPEVFIGDDTEFVETDGYPLGVRSKEGLIVVRRTARDMDFQTSLYVVEIGIKHFSLVASETEPHDVPIHSISFIESHVSAALDKIGSEKYLNSIALFRYIAPAVILIQKLRIGERRRKIEATLVDGDRHPIAIFRY